MGGSRTKIKVEVNYPETEEEIKQFEYVKARAVLNGIRTKCSEEELKLVIERLKKELEENHID